MCDCPSIIYFHIDYSALIQCNNKGSSEESSGPCSCYCGDSKRSAQTKSLSDLSLNALTAGHLGSAFKNNEAT